MVGHNNRLTETAVDAMFKTLHSLTYTYPDYNPLTNVGPRICVICTGFSKLSDDQDDICIEGAVSESAYDMNNKFGELIDKFKEQLTEKIHDELGDDQSKQAIRLKVDAILAQDNFYAFKIFKSNFERTAAERKEIQRLIVDCK